MPGSLSLQTGNSLPTWQTGTGSSTQIELENCYTTLHILLRCSPIFNFHEPWQHWMLISKIKNMFFKLVTFYFSEKLSTLIHCCKHPTLYIHISIFYKVQLKFSFSPIQQTLNQSTSLCSLQLVINSQIIETVQCFRTLLLGKWETLTSVKVASI